MGPHIREGPRDVPVFAPQVAEVEVYQNNFRVKPSRLQKEDDVDQLLNSRIANGFCLHRLLMDWHFFLLSSL